MCQGFSHFQLFLPLVVLAKLANSSIGVKVAHGVNFFDLVFPLSIFYLTTSIWPTQSILDLVYWLTDEEYIWPHLTTGCKLFWGKRPNTCIVFQTEFLSKIVDCWPLDYIEVDQRSIQRKSITALQSFLHSNIITNSIRTFAENDENKLHSPNFE